jgi:hypothetical protein
LGRRAVYPRWAARLLQNVPGAVEVASPVCRAFHLDNLPAGKDNPAVFSFSDPQSN